MLRTVDVRISTDDRAEVLAEAFETYLKWDVCHHQ